MFKHAPRPEEADLFKKGTYEAVVKGAKERTSQKGNAMLELLVEVYGPDGKRRSVYDYLVNTDDMAWKTRHFCEAAGQDYERGEIDPASVIDSSVRVVLDIEPAKNGYKAKNKINDYLPLDKSGPRGPEPFEASDDDVPF